MHCEKCGCKIEKEYNVCPRCGITIKKTEKKQTKETFYVLIMCIVLFGSLSLLIINGKLPDKAEKKENVDVQNVDALEALLNIQDRLGIEDYDVAFSLTRQLAMKESVESHILVQDNKIVESLEDGIGMIFDKKEGIYIGEIEKHKRNGKGLQFGAESTGFNSATVFDGWFIKDLSYYIVKGRWTDNTADGECSLYYKDYRGENPSYSMNFKGTFIKGTMFGKMDMTWVDNESKKQYTGICEVSFGRVETLYERDDGNLVFWKDKEWEWVIDKEHVDKFGTPLKVYDNNEEVSGI